MKKADLLRSLYLEISVYRIPKICCDLSGKSVLGTYSKSMEPPWEPEYSDVSLCLLRFHLFQQAILGICDGVAGEPPICLYMNCKSNSATLDLLLFYIKVTM
jgi:hypothetical protein